ncbi:putative mannosyltransferase-II [Trypanosoma theileri]|uniref:GPI mannosyltransferase 2 n=1 Tax=Trypanosoma theileri TaxID=67003 RepID=A0A1X0P8D2_9TRYP|nr:putative mannosyltransferase-II [Trypanosoma theileri]ORC92690.1 putative mannosyltransferase-II [Trypanosoma theileri]
MTESPSKQARSDVFLQLARCSEIKLFFLVLIFRLLVLMGMIFTHAVLPKIIGVELLFDTSMLLHNDTSNQWVFLDFPRNWDVVHFSHISKYGYSHENVCAFFPFLPTILRIISWVSKTLLPSSLTVIPVSFLAALLNIFLNAAGAVILRRITLLTLVGLPTRDENISLHTGTWLDEVPPPPPSRSSKNTEEDGKAIMLRRWREVGASILMWILSPAGVFTVVPYTESLFSLLTFLGIYFLIIPSPVGRKEALTQAALTEVGAVICFTVAGFVRSNAFICMGFLIYPIFLQIFFFERYKKRFHMRYGNNVLISRWPSFLRCIIVIAEMGIILTPYLVMNYFCFNRFVPLWDNASKSIIGNRFWAFYGTMQKRYWNVGFLASYTLKNLPNVFIASPLVYFTLRTFVKLYLCASQKKIKSPTSLPCAVEGKNGRISHTHNVRSFISVLKSTFHVLIQSSNITCLLFMILFGTTMVHVNVVNRFTVSYPALYWIWARQIVWDPMGGHTVVMFRFFLTWICIGTLFFPNGMPWT